MKKTKVAYNVLGLAKCGNSISSPQATVVDCCLKAEDIIFAPLYYVALEPKLTQ